MGDADEVDGTGDEGGGRSWWPRRRWSYGDRDSKRVGDKYFNLIKRTSFLNVEGRVPRLRLSRVGRMGRGVRDGQLSGH